MTDKYNRVRTKFGPQVKFKVDPVQLRVLETTALEALKTRLLRALLEEAVGTGQNVALRRAASDAAALAWATRYPLLFFPTLPILLYALQSSLGSEEQFARWQGYLQHPLAKLALVAAAWFYAHHFFAGLRYLALDLHWGIQKAPARTSAIVVMVLGVVAALLFAWRIW